MTAISDITAAASSQVTKDRGQLNQDFDDFLTLLTTQLQNQDPLDPQDSSEFTNQLVQFSQVEQQLRGNDILDDLRALDVLKITDLGLSYVGLDVELPGDTFSFDGVNGPELAFNLPEAASETTIAILNENGETVYTTTGETTPGINRFTWEGINNSGFALPPGQYSFNVSATDFDGQSLSASTSVQGRVNGIENDGNNNILLLIGNQKVPITDVTKAVLPPTQTSI